MKIAICEDDLKERRSLKKYIDLYCEEYFWECEIYSFESGEEFLESFKAGYFNIIFLDIYMKDINGIETAKKIREVDNNALIIFCTSSDEFYAEGFEVAATHYLIKPANISNVKQALERCIKALGNIAKKIVVKGDFGDKSIKISDIEFIEVQGHYSNIYTNKEIIKTKTALRDIIETINSSNFILCHRSYYVNLNYVQEMNEDGLSMKSGEVVIVSRNKKKEVYKAIDDFIMEKMWAQ